MEVGPGLAGPRARRLRTAHGWRGPSTRKRLYALATPRRRARWSANTSTERLVTGIRAIDSLLPCGKGQRIGIFGGSGVGKSTLLGAMSRHNSADVTVIALIGERNREVRRFSKMNWARKAWRGPWWSCATSDRPAPLRIRACFVALAIAEYFRDQGKTCCW